MRPERMRVAVDSPHEIVAHGLVALLSCHLDRVQVVDLTGPERHPDVVVVDVAGLAEGRGSDLARLVAETTAAVLAVSLEVGPGLPTRVSEIGADGFVALTVDDRGLLAAVEAAASGDRPPDDAADADNADDDADGAGDGGRGGAGLTEREAEVLTLIVHGHSNQDIADRCFLSINSVKTYIRSAYRRIGVTTRSQAVVWCLQHGFEARPPRPQPARAGQMVATEPESTR